MDITDKQLKRLIKCHKLVLFIIYLLIQIPPKEANQYENNASIAVWYFDGVAYSTLPTITKFESGKKYVYSVLLMPEREYDFGREVASTVNGNAVTAVPATDGYLSLPNVKTITPTAITQVNIESLYNYGVGDFPRKTAEPFDEEADKYEIAHEFCK